MRVPRDDALRRKLEGRAELLEAARLRARALKLILRSVFWKDRLRRNAELLRQMAESQPEVDQALDAALRRAEVEGWDPAEPLTRCLHEVALLREELAGLAARRLRREEARQPLAELLAGLEALLSGPRKILPGQKWSTALEVLPASLPELRRASGYGDLLERLFKRPMDARGALPLSVEEVEALEKALPEAEAALQALWRRAHQCDPSGGLLRFLQRRARRAPVRPPRNGPEELLRVAFWYDLARARLEELASVRLSPVQVAAPELLEVVRWLASREGNPEARLAPSEVLPAARAGLLELAHELWNGARQEAPAFRRGLSAQGPRWPPGHWERLLERARRADAGEPTADGARVRDVLRLFVRIRERSAGRGAEPPEAGTLEALVLRARELAEVGPLGG